jgi:cytochrome c oxidase subunit 2
MGFTEFIKSKKLFSLLTVFMLTGTNLLMAQTNPGDASPAQGAGNSTAAADSSSSMWMGAGYYVLLFLLLCVAVAIVGKILKVYDLTKQIQGKKELNWNGLMGVICIVFLFAGLCGAIWSFAVQGSMTLPEAASLHGVKIDDMFSVTTWITMTVFFITQILLFTFLFRYRHSAKRRAHYLPHNNTIEKIWTIIPAIVLTVLVVFGFFTWQSITDSTDRTGDINIEVTGHQFAWELRYPGADNKLGVVDYRLYTANNYLGVNYKDQNSFDDLRADTMYLPVNKSIRLNIRAQDVIHSCYMPHFRVQLNAVPGLPTYFKFTPTITTVDMRNRLDAPNFEYMLYCNKICGSIHYNMKRVVRVVSEEEYLEWLAKQKPYLTDALKKELKMPVDTTTIARQKNITPNRLALNN